MSKKMGTFLGLGLGLSGKLDNIKIRERQAFIVIVVPPWLDPVVSMGPMGPNSMVVGLLVTLGI